MAIKRFACEKYASLEMNYAEYLATGNIVSQIPLGENFKDMRCENGMIVNADRSQAAIALADENTVLYGIVYTAEKEYLPWEPGLKHFSKGMGDYPRIGVLSKGDTFTTNCLCYDDGEFADEAAIKEAMDAGDVFVGVNAGVMKLTKTAPTTGLMGKAVKFYTVPNGEAGIKVNIARV